MNDENLRKIVIKGYQKYNDKDTKEKKFRIITLVKIDDEEGYGEDVKMLYFDYSLELEQKLKDYLDKKLFNAKVEIKENFATGRIKIIDLIID